MTETQYSLFELNRLIKETIAKQLPNSYWVVAEISEINDHPSGHCYLELIQKDDTTDALKAKARATIWSYTFRMLKPYFETMTNRTLARGMKILVNAQVVFHELYGYSLNITDIEPSYTLGDIELKRRETINKLVSDGIMDMNKELTLNMLPNRIAIISSPSAAGLQDFVGQLINNQFGYTFTYTLFPSIMQGDDAEGSIISSLSKIHENMEQFDAVAIVRGGGAQTDLSCFDSYQLASNIAQFPLPVIAGIGHDKDVSVADMVAHTSLKTPTAVAEFFIGQSIAAEQQATELSSRLKSEIDFIIDGETKNLNSLQVLFQHSCANTIATHTHRIENILRLTPYTTHSLVETNRSRIKSAQAKILLGIKTSIAKHSSYQ